MSDFRLGDVLKYRPEQAHCREGMAVVVDRFGTLVPRDSFWRADDELAHALTEGELASATVLFNLDEVTPIADRRTWVRYLESDRFVLTGQHRLCFQYFVRKGATESDAQVLENARADLAAAEEALRSAQSRVEGERRWVAELERRFVS